MQYSKKFKEQVKVEFEAGIESDASICRKYSIPKQTLYTWRDKFGWVKEVDQKLTLEIQKNAINYFVKNKEEEYQSMLGEHFEQMNDVNRLTEQSIQRLEEEIEKTNNRVSREISETIFAQQKFLKISAETYQTTFKAKKEALGFKDETPTTQVNIQNNIEAAPITFIGIDPDDDSEDRG